ncbi:mitochondrial import receptor subunit TOM20 homolog B-like [Culicoides brevitarsis]|uniref:mitochondrial import receptor subunit TOM20 homolog B-like n=1 Tax=Culicoides brevitarsis TaxID=469753 RepID=UPI00307CA2B1
MTELSRTAIVAGLGTAAVAFLGYCIYFDHKRRSDPEYKKKVRERRRRQKKAGAKRTQMPNLQDHDAVQRFFLQEIQTGEAMIAAGEVETGVEHLANAVVVCGQPAQLLQILQQTLPAQIFTMLIQRMRVMGNPSESQEPRLVEEITDDLE